MKIIKQLCFLLLLSLISTSMLAQIDDEQYYDSLLYETITPPNPVYLPVIGAGIGVINFYGELNNNDKGLMLGAPAFKFNVSTFLDRQKHMFRANFFLIFGTIYGEKRSTTDLASNINFKSDIVDFGLNIHYDFKPFFRTSPFRPFVSLGIENVQFNSKGDLMNQEGVSYNYWTDGTIRNAPEPNPNAEFMHRDYKYESDLRDLDLYGLGNYMQSTLAIPFEVGLDYQITDRLNLRVAHSWHYTFSDNIDNVSKSNKTGGIVGNKSNDMFTFTSFSMHFDLFSGDRAITVKNMFADVDFNDYELFSDEDFDQVLDLDDQCPGTPLGVAVDTITGCPLDDDKDGVPNYLDKEIHSKQGAMVDENGVELNTDAYASQLSQEAILRKDVDMFLLMHRAQSKYGRKTDKPIPSKFKTVDSDGDNYISFEELLKSIDDYFDFSTNFTSKDIYELQDYFFEQ